MRNIRFIRIVTQNIKK